MHNIEVVIVFISVILILFYVQKKYLEVEYVKSSIDDRMYLVRNTHNKDRAADILAKLNIKISKLLGHLKYKFPDNSDITRLVSNYNVDTISEGTETSNYTSYSVNKGEKIVFCLRSRDGLDSFVDENVLMYVATHELAHLMTKDVGHTDNFWSNFKFILQEAIDIKVYTKVDFSSSPTDYCGIKIRSSVI